MNGPKWLKNGYIFLAFEILSPAMGEFRVTDSCHSCLYLDFQWRKKSNFQALFFKSLTSAACTRVMKKPCSIISPRLVFENGLQPITAPLYKDDKRLLLASAGFLQRSLLMDVFLQIWESTGLQHLWDARLSQSPCLDVLRTSDLMLILSGLLVCDSPALQNQISFLICLIFIITTLL